MSDPTGEQAADDYLFATRRQLEWVPVIGNGAAILALADIIANAPNQDAALNGLSVTLSLFAAGICCALGSASCAAWSFQQQTYLSKTAQRMHDKLNPLIASFNVAEGTEKIPFGKELMAYWPTVEAERPRLEKSLRKMRRFERWTSVLRIGAMAACVSGFMVLVIGHRVGLFTLSAG